MHKLMELIQIENIMLRFMIVVRAYYGTRIDAVFHDSLYAFALNATINGYLSVCNLLFFPWQQCKQPVSLKRANHRPVAVL